MSESMSRRQVLASVAPVVLLAGRLAAQPPTEQAASPKPDGSPDFFPFQDPKMVKEIVGASHRDVDRVKALLKEAPRLANAVYDWGYGDWETALGAASHTGRRNIAAVLLEHGARADIFALAMLGNLEAVKGMVAAHPGIQRVKGPHGITLLKHALAGGDQSAAVAEYLTALGDADVAYKDLPLTQEERDACVGEYSFGPRSDQRILIQVNKNQGRLVIQRVNGNAQNLFHQGGKVFHPPGSPETRVEVGNGVVKVVGSGVEVVGRK